MDPGMKHRIVRCRVPPGYRYTIIAHQKSTERCLEFAAHCSRRMLLGAVWFGPGGGGGCPPNNFPFYCVLGRELASDKECHKSVGALLRPLPQPPSLKKHPASHVATSDGVAFPVTVPHSVAFPINLPFPPHGVVAFRATPFPRLTNI